MKFLLKCVSWGYKVEQDTDLLDDVGQKNYWVGPLTRVGVALARAVGLAAVGQNIQISLIWAQDRHWLTAGKETKESSLQITDKR